MRFVSNLIRLIPIFLPLLLSAQGKNVQLYAFGNSLVDHRPPTIPTPSDETAIPHWMYDISQAANTTFAVTGQYGFLVNHVNNLPPTSLWGYQNVPFSWEETQTSFANSGLNTVLLTVDNFIQYVEPTDPYPLDYSTTVVEATETIFSWVRQRKDTARLYLYASWPEMDLQNEYPPNLPAVSEVAFFHNSTIGPFTDWWIDYQDALMASQPQWEVRLIPVGQIISKLLRNEYPDVPFDELYEDSAPHGRPTLYFLAGMITYMAMFEEPIPVNYQPSSQVHPIIRNNLQDINTFVWNELNAFKFPNGQSRVFYDATSSTVDFSPSEISIFPNPMMEEMHVEATIESGQIELFNNLGQNVLRYDFEGKHIKIDVSALENGLFNMVLKNEKGKIIASEKVLKEN